MSFEQATTRLL